MLLAGEVDLLGAGSRTLKPGQLVAGDATVHIAARPRWASRAGQKLEAALDAFAVDPSGLACLDSGASTGGFTDVLLARGARIVYAVDVGRGQLLDRLQRDPRVVSMERTNLRDLRDLPEPVALATLDLSFISLRLVLRPVRALLAPRGRVIALVKPQFEAGRDAVPRGGVIWNPAVHRQVLRQFASDAAEAGLPVRALAASPVRGGDGNREFLALLTASASMPESRLHALIDALTAPTEGRPYYDAPRDEEADRPAAGGTAQRRV